ncbi:MAG: ABC transporter substrate-binding protein, partial [Acidimicrobiales bacterium]
MGLLAVASMVAAACGSSSPGASNSPNTSSGTNTASAPGITPTTITIGSHQPLTGVAAPGYDEIAPASNAFFQYVNSKGGVYGRSIKYNYLDDGYNPSNTVKVVRQLVQQDHVFAIFNGLGTPTHTAVEPFLNAEHVPDLFVASGCL